MTEVINIPNIGEYIQEIINGELILTPKKQHILTQSNIIIRRIQSLGRGVSTKTTTINLPHIHN